MRKKQEKAAQGHDICGFPHSQWCMVTSEGVLIVWLVIESLAFRVGFPGLYPGIATY